MRALLSLFFLFSFSASTFAARPAEPKKAASAPRVRVYKSSNDNLLWFLKSNIPAEIARTGKLSTATIDRGLKRFHNGKPIEYEFPQEILFDPCKRRLKDAPFDPDIRQQVCDHVYSAISSAVMSGDRKELRERLTELQVFLENADLASEPREAPRLSPGSFDLSRFWGPTTRRCQHRVGSCHSFAAVALAEAYLFQKTDKHWDLSERDLFESVYLEGDVGRRLARTLALRLPAISAEAGSAWIDYEFLKKQGVCLETDYPYENKDDGCLLEKQICGIRKGYREFLKSHPCPNNDPLPMAEEDLKIYEDVAFKAGVAAMIESHNKISVTCEDRRREVRELLAGTSLDYLDLKGRDSEAKWVLIHDLLSTDRPMEVSFSDYPLLRGIQPAPPNPGEDPDRAAERREAEELDAGHSVVVMGYDKAADQLLIRNSWGNIIERVDRIEALKQLQSILYVKW